MIATTCGAWLILSQSVLGWPGHHAPAAVAYCDSCGVEKAIVLEEITRLQNCPRWRDRDHAAHVLRKFDWRCHPEIVGALAFSLLRDREEEVREEAAQSLAKMAPCLPVAHEALTRAAECDPDWATRFWARKALKALRRRCEGTCEACGPEAIGGLAPLPEGPAKVIPGPPLGPGEVIVPSAPAGPSVEPPLDLPALPPGTSPFSGANKPQPPEETKVSSRGRPRLWPSFIGRPQRSRIADRSVDARLPLEGSSRDRRGVLRNLLGEDPE